MDFLKGLGGWVFFSFLGRGDGTGLSKEKKY